MRQAGPLIATILFGLLTGLGLIVAQTQSSLAQTTLPTKPNILFVLTDDMRASGLRYMPKTRYLLAGGVVKLTNAFVTRSLCGPSKGPSCEVSTPTTSAKQRPGAQLRFLGRYHAALLRGRPLAQAAPALESSGSWRSAFLVEHWRDEN